MRLIYRRLARFEMGPHETVSAQLGALGYRAEDVRWVVLSHLHQDHIGGLRELTGARFVVSTTQNGEGDEGAERRDGRLPAATHGPARGDLGPVTFGAATTDAALAKKVQPLHDLLGDGSLVLLPTPGHTGSMSMLVRGRDAPLLLVGDLTYDVEGMQHQAPAQHQ